jgi:hypothetical protein
MRGEQVANTGLLPSVFSRLTHSARTTLRTRPPLPPSAREYTPARSADKHLAEAHWRKPSILSPAVIATCTTFCAAGPRAGLGIKKGQAGDREPPLVPFAARLTCCAICCASPRRTGISAPAPLCQKCVSVGINALSGHYEDRLSGLIIPLRRVRITPGLVHVDALVGALEHGDGKRI